jgi:hypothetical protein
MSVVEGEIEGQDVDRGKLFEVPRVAIVIDESDPTVVKLAFSGSVELDRGNAQQIEFYNRLNAGDESDVTLTVHVAGAQKRHRRDAEGFVDAIVETKSLVVSDVYVEQGDER